MLSVIFVDVVALGCPGKSSSSSLISITSPTIALVSSTSTLATVKASRAA